MRYGWVVLFASVGLVWPAGVQAQRAPDDDDASVRSVVKRVEARAIRAEPPRLDGVLDDPAWQLA